MTVVRELVARLGFQVDKAGFKEAEKALDNVRKSVARTDETARRSQSSAGAGMAAAANRWSGGKFRVENDQGHYRDAGGRMRDGRGRYVGKGAAAGAAGAAVAGADGGGMMKTLGKLAATAGITHMVKSMVEMASAAEETKNVLGAVFGQEGQAEVSSWAARTAVEVGRSKYQLEQFVGQLGAVAAPMLGNKERAREMSESYAKLAVDMGSFYDATDEDALHALRSAMTGEVESIKRFGVVMNEATLAEYARTQGITKKISAMTNAEKTELRYGYIMKVTAAVQGDAARTGDSYANSIKRVSALMTDFGTDMGRAVLPKIEKLLIAVANGITTFKEWTDGTYVLESALYVLSAIAAVLAVDLLAPFILPALAIGALILLVDDLYNLFNEGESVIGNLLDEMFGFGTAEAVVNGFADAWGWLSQTFTELQQTLPDIVGIFDMILGVGDDLGFCIETLITNLLEFIDTVITLPSKLGGFLGKKAAEMLGIKVEQDDAEGRAKDRGLGADTMGFGDKLNARQRDREGVIRGETTKREEVRVKRRAERDKQLRIRELQKNIAKDQDQLTSGKFTDQKERDTHAAGLEDERRELARLTGADSEAATMVTEEAGAAALAAQPRFGVARHRRGDAPVIRAVDPTLTAPPAAAAAAPAGGNTTVQQSNVFHISGPNPQEIGKIVDQKLGAANRRTAAAVPRPAGA